MMIALGKTSEEWKSAFYERKGQKIRDKLEGDVKEN
jgi:hypothetical protein